MENDKRDLGASAEADRAATPGGAEPEVSGKAGIPSACRVCDSEGWVCENHADRPWDGVSAREDACGCGAGMPCGACNLELASARYSEPWRVLADRAIGRIEDAVKDTSWGQPTFGPDYGEEMRDEYDALLSAIATEAQRAETVKQGSVHEGAGIAQNTPGSNSLKGM